MRLGIGWLSKSPCLHIALEVHRLNVPTLFVCLFVCLQPIGGTMSQQVLEEAKAFIQEELRRKANQKEALAVMDEEQKRLVHSGGAIYTMQQHALRTSLSVLIRGICPL